MTDFLTLEQVVEIHKVILPGDPVINYNNLASAIGRPQATYFGEYLHQTLAEQAAALLQGLSQAHGFRDGNKRTAMISCITFLHVNDVELMEVDEKEMEDLVVSVMEDDKPLSEIAEWILDNT